MNPGEPSMHLAVFLSELALFAQKSGGDDMFFRLLLIPISLFLVFIGVLAVRQKRIYLRKWRYTLNGLPAVLLGGLIAVLGVSTCITAIASFFITRKP
jgi:hypothetical protein